MRKLRVAFILSGLAGLALISMIFGLMMAVAQSLPELESRNEYRTATNSVIYDIKGRRIATLTGSDRRILVPSDEISLNMKHAVVAIEDKRFYQHAGIDYQGIARALWQDISRKRVVQGGSTITQQFVKNALVTQSNRTLFQKLKESALAYHLERKWSKDKVLTEYLNTVYFGEGAYGIESAARSYFGVRAADLTLPQAALLAGIIASPSAYNPAVDPAAAKKRRDLVLAKMLDSELIAGPDYRNAVRTAIPSASEIHPPRKDSKSPYFTEYITQQLVDRYGAGTALGGGLRIYTTLDLELQRRAEQVISEKLSGVGPSAALVAIDNSTGGIRAMVGGSDFEKRPFNLATHGRRQPGSAFKPFTTVTALENGIKPDSTWSSHLLTIKGPEGKYVVHNYEDQYSGVITLADATRISDNSVYVQIGRRVGTDKIARTANRMGIQTKLSRNTAMILGGLKKGVTPLEMAHAFLTIARNGKRVSGTLSPTPLDPPVLSRVEDRRGRIIDRDRVVTTQAIPENVARTVKSILQTVISGGTGKNAAIGEFAAGKTGTTENFGDAWFVGFTNDLTVAVWVGYPDRLKQMETEYHGGPVAGGTFPAEIWRDFMLAAISLSEPSDEGSGSQTPPPATPGPTTTAAPSQPITKSEPSKKKPQKRKPDTEPSKPRSEKAPEPDSQEPPSSTTPPPEPSPKNDGGGMAPTDTSGGN